MSDTLASDIGAFEEQERRKVDLRRKLIDEALNGLYGVPVTRGIMGGSESFHGTVTLSWIDKNVKLFTQLPLFKTRVDSKGNFVVDEGTAADLRQRAPNWSRQPLLVNYLLRQPTRMFPPMLVVVEETWVNDPGSDGWEPGPDGEPVATRTSIEFYALDSQGRLGLVDLTNATAFVIDGSHRWIGINGLEELITTGHLTLKKRDGGSSGKVETLDELAARFDLNPASIPAMANESMGIEFIPAVMKGETREQARRRIRSVFVHVNKSAEPPTQSEQALLDEDDGFAVVGRETAFDHPLFRQDSAGDRVNWKGTALPEGSKWLTTGKTLRDSVEAYLGKDEHYANWKASSSKEIAVRPSEDDLEQGKVDWIEYLDRLPELPSFGDILRGGKIDEWRAFGTASNSGRGHLLMRPLGQLILADAVGFLHRHPNGPQMSLQDIFTRLQRYESHHGFENVHEPTSHWWGLTFDPQRGTMYMGGRKVAVAMLRYLLGDDTMDRQERDELRAEFARLRTVLERSYDWDGTELDDGDKVQLPPQI